MQNRMRLSAPWFLDCRLIAALVVVAAVLAALVLPADTVSAITDLFNELRHQYLITFEPGTRPGWHPLEIRTRNRNHVVRARSGYMSDPARSGN